MNCSVKVLSIPFVVVCLTYMPPRRRSRCGPDKTPGATRCPDASRPSHCNRCAPQPALHPPAADTRRPATSTTSARTTALAESWNSTRSAGIGHGAANRSLAWMAGDCSPRPVRTGRQNQPCRWPDLVVAERAIVDRGFVDRADELAFRRRGRAPPEIHGASRNAARFVSHHAAPQESSRRRRRMMFVPSRPPPAWCQPLVVMTWVGLAASMTGTPAIAFINPNRRRCSPALFSQMKKCPFSFDVLVFAVIAC